MKMASDLPVMGTIIGLCRISRPLNVFFIVLCSALGPYLIGFTGAPWRSLIAGVALASLSVSGYTLNDLVDLSIDKVNRPTRALPSGLVKPIAAKVFCLITAFSGLLIGTLTSTTLLVFLLIVAVLIAVYDLLAKPLGLPGNFIVALLTASALIPGALAEGLTLVLLWAPLSLAFLMNLAREIMKDTEDIPGDKGAGIKTIPLAFGSRVAMLISSFIMLMVLPVTVAYAVFEKMSMLFWFLVALGLAVPILVLTISIWHSRDAQTSAAQIQRWVKFVMLSGLLAFYLGGTWPPPPFL
jgi:geranylgeranylglycerol-phosphate geranylgeranyltransferase